jgi:oligopeptide/dipeptide ABC transporter ATP-binding protein
MIAVALACEPAVLIADEPTTALDVTIQAQIIDLLNHMKQTYGMSTILITHDIGLAAEFADRVIVMYGGRVVETAPTRQLLTSPQHPYSIGLLENARMRKGQLSTIPGQPPDMVNPPSGCRFHPRCAYATAVCKGEQPGATVLGPGHLAHCWNMDEVRQ